MPSLWLAQSPVGDKQALEIDVEQVEFHHNMLIACVDSSKMLLFSVVSVK